MALPEQITADELREKLDERVRRLDQAQIADPGVTLRSVRAASVEEEARGACVVQPTTERVVDLPFFASSVAVTYQNLPEGPMRVQTGSARLIKVGESWRRRGLTGRWSGEHVFSSPGGTVTLIFHVPQSQKTPILPPEPVPQSYDEPTERYEIPPAATAIRGDGTIKYRSGHEVDVSDEKRLLLRPLADGTLGSRPGGVYAEFESDQPPEVKLGTTWIEAKPTEETPKT